MEGGKEGRQAGRKEGRKEGRRTGKEGWEGRDRQKTPHENEEDAKIEPERGSESANGRDRPEQEET